jgi:uncharacterized membrane protein
MGPQISEYTSSKYVVACVDGSRLISVVILAFIQISHSSILSGVLLNSHPVTALGNSMSAFCPIWPSLSCHIKGSYSIYSAVASFSGFIHQA